MFRRLRVCGQQSPIDVTPITDVVVVGLLCGVLQHLRNHVLRRLGLLQEQLHYACEELHLNHCRLIMEVAEEGVEKLVDVIDPLRILAENPDHRCLRLGFVKHLQAVTQGRQDLLVARRIFPEDVLNHDSGLLHDIVHLRLDELEEDADGAFASTLELHGHTADGAHRLPHEVHIHAGGILLELEEYLLEVFLGDEHHHDVDLLQLHVDGIVVLAEEHLHIRREDARALLHDQPNVPQGDILDLRLAREERHQRRIQLLGEHTEHLGVVDVLHAPQDNLDGRKNHRRVCV
mmetsp:Transcript_26227/g.55615  ORF Transcript_26227/g.55615 Transcript_26227/m.55615 type:complete len:290 (-) Transcript_26227:1023-1892(-)